MPDNIYEILSLGMRWWFVLLGLLIVFRAYAWLMRDRREKHERLRKLPDAGCIGELLVLQGNNELPRGVRIPVSWQGTLGFVRGNDLVVPVQGVAYTHLDCEFEEGEGLIVRPRFHCSCMVDGVQIHNEAQAKRRPMLHGSVLQVGDCVLELQVLAGLSVDHAREMRPQAFEQPEKEKLPRSDAPQEQMPGETNETGWTTSIPPQRRRRRRRPVSQ